MAGITGNTTGHGSSLVKMVTEPEADLLKSYSGKTSLTLYERIQFHDNLHKQSKCDLETPASIIANVNIKQLLTPAAFDSLPTHYQNELIKLLPEADRVNLSDETTPLAMTVNALSNEFFAKSCVEYRERLRNGEFCTSATNSRIDIDPVVWECDSNVLRLHKPRSDIPKAGQAFICTSKGPLRLRTQKTAKKVHAVAAGHNKVSTSNKLKKSISSAPANTKSLLKPTKPTFATPVKPVSHSTAVAQKAVSKAKAVTVSQLKSKDNKERSPVQIAGVKRSRSDVLQTKPPTIKLSTDSAQSKQSSSPKPGQVIITKFKKVTENGSFGGKVTKVVPIVVRSPHGQVVTTLANCNPLLTQMIRNPVNSQTHTTVPIRVERRQSLLPTILKRSNQVIVTLRNTSNMVSHKNGVNKAVNEVISRVKTSCAQQLQQTNGNRPTPVIVTVNGSNGSVASKIISTAVNIERSKQICESSKQMPPTLNLERSYQICKQVLGKTEGATIVVVGPGGKRKIISKPVRNRHPNDHPAGSNNNSSYCSTDIPVYRNKHRGKPTLTLSGHVFLAMKDDTDGYAAKAYKRKTAFKQKHKKKLSKVVGKKILTAASTAVKVTQVGDSVNAAKAADLCATSTSSSVTVVTDTKHATQPVLSVKETSGSLLDGVTSLLDSCMCNKRALIICRKCGAFCHAECTNSDHCLACLDTGR